MTSTTSQFDRVLSAPSAAARSAALHLPMRAALYGLLILSALPDAMVPPLLRELFVVRYGVTDGAAHWFMAVNLAGAALAVPMLIRLRKTVRPAVTLAIAAAINGILLACLAMPVGFGASLALRVMEGAVDLIVFAMVFDLIVQSGDPATRGRRLGLASGLLMLAIGSGLALGGVIGAHQPVLVFITGAAACFAVALASTAIMFPRATSFSQRAARTTTRVPFRVWHLWPTMTMAWADRAVAGLFTATIPLYFASVLELSTQQAGGLLGATMLCMAICSWPAGLLSDRLGHLRVRAVAALLYALCVAALALAPSFSAGVLIAIMALVGITGSALMPTSLALATRFGDGAVAMGALHASGNIGFFVGIVCAGLALDVADHRGLTINGFALAIAVLALVHVLMTIVTTIALLVRSRRQRRTVNQG